MNTYTNNISDLVHTTYRQIGKHTSFTVWEFIDDHAWPWHKFESVLQIVSLTINNMEQCYDN